MNTKVDKERPGTIFIYPQEQSHLKESNSAMLRDRQNTHEEPIV